MTDDNIVKLIKYDAKLGTNLQKEQFFDSGFISDMPEIKITRIDLYGDQYLSGIQVFYKYYNQVVSSGAHCTVDLFKYKDKLTSKFSDHKSSKVNMISMVFDDDEYVSNIEVKAGFIIDSLCLKTNKGKEIKAGGKGGNLHKISIDGCKLAAINGSYCSNEMKDDNWCTIHNLEFYFCKI